MTGLRQEEGINVSKVVYALKSMVETERAFGKKRKMGKIRTGLLIKTHFEDNF